MNKLSKLVRTFSKNRNGGAMSHWLCMLVTVLMFLPLPAFAEMWGLYCEEDGIMWTHPAIVLSYHRSTSTPKGTCQYMNFNFKIDDKWSSTQVEFDNLDNICLSTSSDYWKPIDQETRYLSSTNVEFNPVPFKVLYRSGGRNSDGNPFLQFAVVFEDVDALYSNKDKNIQLIVVTYRNRLEGLNGINPQESKEKTIKVSKPSADSGIEAGWALEPTLDMTVPESEIGKRMCMLRVPESLEKVKINGTDYKITGSVTDQIALAKGVDRIDLRYYLTLKDLPLPMPIKADCLTGFDSKVKQLSTICDLDFERKFSRDEKGHAVNSRTIKWKMNTNDPNNDVVDGDQFLVLRARHKDFSDAKIVSTVAFTDYKTRLYSSSALDWYQYYYSVDDTDEEAFYNSAHYGDSVYYRVVRAVVYAKWPEHRGDYCQEYKSVNALWLPLLKDISVTKDDSYADTKTVNVKVNIDASDPFRYRAWDEGAKIVIQRYSPQDEWYEGTDYASKTIIIDGEDVKYDPARKMYYAEVEDAQNAPFTHYYYKATIDATNSNFALREEKSVASVEDCYFESLANIQSITAQKGDARGFTKVEWSVGNGENDGYVLERRPYKQSYTNGEEWEEVAIDNAKAKSYIDEKAYPGSVYEYRVKGYLDVRGKRYWTGYVSDYGYTKFYARAKGTILMDDGSAWPFKTVMRLMAGDGGVHIPEVKDRNTGKTIIDAININKGEMFETELREDGTFEFDSIPYIANENINSIYELSTTADNVQNPTGSMGAFQISFTTSRFEYTDIRFTSSNTRICEGRIIFAGSTIPSRGIKFKVVDGNEERVLVDSKGEPVTTDNNGKYRFALPYKPQGVRVVAFKEGHKLKYDGVIQGKPGVVNVVCDIQDSTTVRLVGRLVGGLAEGKKPLGYGFSKNNLADNVTLVLQLEGDNSSYITYNDEEPDNTTREAMFTQTATAGNSSYTCAPTSVTFERKRIVITPDKETGEFCLDLAPTKYKITQMYGTGYATFFAEGEGAAVIDLTQDGEIQTFTCDVDDVEYTTQYHHAFNRTYRVPVELTYKQYVDGMETDYFGDKKLETKSIFGKSITPFAYDNGKYTFDYPVFSQGHTYRMKVTAHEDYYYNNNVNTMPDVVTLGGDTLHVVNGFMMGDNELTATLDSLGSATFDLGVNNTSFCLSDEDALRELNMSVKLNGYYYEAEPLKAYVTGIRTSEDGSLGTDVLPLVTVKSPKIEIMDIIRDPYTSSGYAYRERGTTYTMSRSQSFEFGIDIDLTLAFGNESSMFYGAWVGMGGGAFTGTESGGSSMFTVNTTIPGIHSGANWDGEYELTLNERIQTSSEPKDVGAMSDVYVGLIPTYSLYHTEAFNVVDEETYGMLADSFRDGRAKLVASGTYENGEKYYLIIADQLTMMEGKTHTFAYSQKHILNNVLPELARKLDEIVVEGTKEQVQAIADKNNKVYYRITKKDFNLWTDDDWYEEIRPSGDNSIKNDEARLIISTIKGWLLAIRDNENRKLLAMEKGTLLKRYSISDVEVDYSQDASYWYVHSVGGSILGLDISSNGVGVWKGISVGAETESAEKKFGETNEPQKESMGVNGQDHDITFNLPGSAFKIGLKPDITASYSDSRTRNKTYLAGSGFHLGEVCDGYFDIDVYTEPVDTAKVGDNENWVWDKNLWKWISSKGEKDYEMGQNHDFVFVVRGGAERAPWHAPDSTIVAYPSKPLGAQTLKIDNPKIYIAQTTVNNLPKSERAVFSLRLTNETEYQGNLDSADFYLFQQQETNPDGARLFVDGKALGDGIAISLAPGESIVKTLEVERGAKAYDYENIGITFADESYSLYDTRTISVHYLPESTPVRITTPTDKWVMNTLSSKDEDGKYYIPVKIDGFDVNCDNFDHIEFQYKKQTEGESAWTNLCSYYAKDDEYYQRATGTKKLLTSGSISDLRFYGEKDPMEMKYDLRAVSFCRLGTGYVTYASPVASGIKDTRTPDIFGNPEPSSGILGHGDILSLTFSEDIAYNYLDETANFQVTGYTNTSAVESKNYLILGNTINATSLAESYVATHDFSVEMMATVEKPDAKSVLFKTVSEETPETNIVFCVNANRLELYRSNMLVAQSEVLPVDMRGGLTHVGFTYGYDDRAVRFFVGDNVIKSEIKTEPVLSLMGHVVLENTDNKVGINNLRTWYKELSSNEIANLTNAQLSGKEIDIIAYWPLVDGFGCVAKDCANGNNMVVTNPEWHTMDGKSLLVYQKPVVLQGQEAYKFSRQATEDYTLAFWFQNWWLDETKDNISLFHAGDSKIDTEDGRMNIFLKSENDKHYLKLECGGEVFDFGTSEFTTLQWHHIALSVNHSLNSVNMYLDGEMVGQIPGTKVGGISTSEIVLGDENTAGLYDEIEFWHLALPANYLKNNFCTQRNGNEMGMAVYLPFETMKRDGTIYNLQFSALNQASYVEPGKSAINTNAREPLFDVAGLKDIEDIKQEDQCWGVTDFEAPVNASEGIESLPFSWTGTDTKLQINIKKEDYDINGRYINVTVRGVEDLAGNPMSNPVMWTVYVQRNALFFADKNIRTTTTYGEKKNVTTTLKNESGRRLSYTVDPNCTWLTPSLAYGQLEPLEEQNIDLEISDGLSPGDYSTKVMLEDENGLSTSLNVYVTVTIEEPSWAITTDKAYNRTMNIMSTVYQQNNAGQWVIDADTKDIVGAFVDNVCVGKSHLTVDKVTGTSCLYMTIRGREQDQNKDIVFRLWDASSGNILYLDRGERVDGKWNTLATTFEHDAVIGADSPVEMRTTLSRTQTIALSEGWNWISFNVSPPVGKNVFMDTDLFTPDDMFKCAGGTSIYKGNGEWTSVDTFVPTKNNVYEVYVKNPGKLSVDGSVLSDEELEITLDFGNKSWAEMAYLLDVTLPVNVALADFPIGAKAPVGTMIKSYNEFAVARADGQWVGSLQHMRPGIGYYVNCNGDKTTKTIRYIRSANARTRNKIKAVLDSEEDLNKYEVSSAQFESMMPVIATFKDGDVCAGDILVAYSNGQVVGVAEPGVTNNGVRDSEYDSVFFMSVHAADGDKIDFVKYRDGEAVAATKKKIAFSATGVVGTLDSPYLIDFSETSSGRIYDLSGRRYSSLPSNNGMYIIGNKKISIKK